MTSHLRLIGTRFQNYGGREMSNPSLGQIVNLCKNQKMNQIYVEIDALTVEMFSTVDYKRSTVFHQTFKVFI